MVSNRQLNFINQRLQEFFRTKELFGGHSIFVGDLWQQPPIGGSHIYMVTANIYSDLANGAIGILKYVSMKTISGVAVPTTVWLKFPESRSGTQAREAYSGHKPSSIDPSWTPIKLETKPVKYWEGRQVRVVGTQFPLTLAETITIFKLQSQNFTEMVLTTHPGITRSLL